MIKSANRPVSGERLPCLDGWRALAIALVLIQHSYPQPGWPIALSWWPLSTIGGVGVRFFFVISGFLITWLMLNEQSRTGKVSLKMFYVRRCLRILPVYFMFLATVGLFQSIGGYHVSINHWLKCLTFTVNYGGAHSPVGHLWSLGVEEQFYLLWPPLAVWAGVRNRKRLTSMLLIPIVVCPLLRWYGGLLDHSSPLREIALYKHAFPTIADGLSIGCLGGIAWKYYESHLHKALCRWRYPLVTAACLGIVAPVVFWLVPQLRHFQALQDTLQCGGFLILLLSSLAAPKHFLFRPLSWGPVAYVGVISYSLYLWMAMFEFPPSGLVVGWLQGFPGWLVGATGMAMLSYHFLEKPLLAKKAALLRWFGSEP